MSFVGRERELDYLDRAWRARSAAFVPVYGRRRVGKSELLLHFLRDRAGLYFLGKQTPAAMQIQEFLSRAAVALGEPLLAEVSTDDWKKALELVLDRCPAGDKFAIVMDEFQWTVEASPELPSVLQEIWDRRIREDPRFLLIVCGSYVGFMEREVLGRKSPLFGRRTGVIHLKPFGFREARQFHPNFSLRNSARTYFVCGGVPAYLRAFAGNRSVEANIRDAILDEFGPLYGEPDFLLREELREVQNYHAILMFLAQGSATPTEIAKQIGVPDRSVHYYLDQLVGLSYVQKHAPITAPGGRRVKYRLDDALLRFWFRFVYPNLGELKQSGASRLFDRKIRPQFDSWCGGGFERLCREALPEIYADDGIDAAFEVGEYWDKSVQIDVMGLRDDSWTDIGECKWGSNSASSLVDELRSKAGRFPNKRGATIALHAFVQRVPRGADDAIRWHSLEELYGA